MNLYPLQFQAIFKDRIWGGTKLNTFLDKPITSKSTGESWEISTIENSVSVVSNGIYEGQSLNDLVLQFPQELLGTKVYQMFGAQFPLLFKYLDARENLSIQVHPNDEIAKVRHNSFGKTEMWYVIQADKDAELIVGFKEQCSRATYEKSVEDKTILQLLDNTKVVKGDVFMLETGTVHALGAGILIAEIQQTSDITYRIYDFERVDADGNSRALHIDLALDAINYEKVGAKKSYSKIENQSNPIVTCPYFTTNIIPLSGTLTVLSNPDSFKVFMCVEGSFVLTLHAVDYYYKLGDTVLLPAAINDFEISGTATILEIYI